MLKNKVAIITGANRGIGLETLKLFNKNNAKIFACVRKESDEFKECIKKINSENNSKIEVIKLDLENESSVKEAANLILSKTDKVDILVNNAGQILTSSFLMTPIQKIKDLFQINFFSQLLFSQYIIKKMIKSKNGSIINISSSSAIEGNEGRLAYAASKSALSTSTKVMARELSSFNIRCNTVSPGLTDTKMMNDSTTLENKEKKIKELILKRVAKPEEIANTILFLASHQSSYITGEVIKVDGGML
tara:strand:+ start:58 stop:801 length:744 start_codon:yes stop_codon:yes gene_type:complete